MVAESHCTQKRCMSLISGFDHPHPMVQVEYKTKWAASLEDLPGYFERKNRRSHLSVLEQHSIDAASAPTLRLHDLQREQIRDTEQSGACLVFSTCRDCRLQRQNLGIMDRLISIQLAHQACSKPSLTISCLPKLRPPGFMLPPLPKYLLAATLVHL